MNKLFSKVAALSVGLAMAIGVGVAVGEKAAARAEAVEVVYYEATFASADNSGSSGGYSSTWSTTHNGFEWTIENFNNNNNGWDGYVKCGRKDVASVANITTKNAVSEKVTKVTITIDAITSSKINSITLYKGTAADSITTSLGTFSKSKGTQSITIASANQGTNLYYKIVFDCAAGTSNGLLTLSDVSFYKESSAVSPESISCAAQTINVVESVDLSNAVVFTPASTTQKGLTFSIKSGADKIDLTEAGVVKGKKSGSAAVTITPQDTSAGAKAIDVVITVNAIPAPDLTIGDQYVIYEPTAKKELTGISSNLGTATDYTGDVPSCSYVLTTEDGYFENTVAFSDGTNYLSLNAASNNLHTTDGVTANSSWIVSVTNDVISIKNGAFPNRELKYNADNPRFACYTSGQIAIALYHYEEKALQDFTIDSEINVYVSGTNQIGVTYDPADAADKTLDWSSADEDIAIVDDKGVVTGVAVGEVVVTASKTIGGNKVERECTVHVLSNVSTHRGTEADPFNVEDAVNVAKGVFTKDPDGNPISLANEYHVKGLITANATRTTGQLSFWIGDNASQISAATGGFEVFRAAKVYGVALGTAYTEDKQVTRDFNVGYHVLVKSTFTYYQGTTPETNQNVADIIYSDYIEARKFAEGFNSAFEAEGVCNDQGGSDVAVLAGVWSAQATAYDALDDDSVAIIEGTPSSSAENATAIAKCLAKYDYIGGKYQTQLGAEYDFMGRNPSPVVGGAYMNFNNILSSDNTMIIVVSIATISALALTMLLVFKKKKQR